MKKPLPPLLLLSAVLALPPFASAQDREAPPLGRVDFGVSCDGAVRADFDRGVALLHHMTYPAAYSTFEQIAQEDPACALAYWGMAMTLFQPLWPNRPGPDELARGWTLVQRAQALHPADAREAGFVAAAAAFFDPAGDPDYWARIERWAEAQATLHERFPEDREVSAFYALSDLATASRDADPALHHRRAAAVLADILRDEPTHPGAVHYTIHANDFDGRQNESLDVVRRYGEIAPRNPHALHMPTHIFVRLGLWDEVIDWNLRAADAALEQPVGPNGEFVWDEYPHAVEYLTYAWLQLGDDRAAREAIEALHANPNLERSFKTAFHLASTQARYALERHDWRGATAITPRSPHYLRWNLFWWPEATVWHARGLGAVHLGDVAGVEESLRRLDRLATEATDAGEGYFATQIRILEHEILAWNAYRTGDRAVALAEMQQAVSLEERTPKHPVTPGPTLPARELLGDLWLELGEPERALAEYEREDARAPGRFNAMLGMARASAALGRTDEAREHYRRLLDQAVEGSERGELDEARRYLEGR